MESELFITSSIEQLSINANFSAKAQCYSNFISTVKQLELLSKGYSENKQPRWTAITTCSKSVKAHLDTELICIPDSPADLLKNEIVYISNVPENVDKKQACKILSDKISAWRSSLNRREYSEKILSASQGIKGLESLRYLTGSFAALLMEQGWNWSGIRSIVSLDHRGRAKNSLDRLFPQVQETYRLSFHVDGVSELSELNKVFPGAFCWKVKDDSNGNPSLIYFNVDKEKRSKFRWHFSRKLMEGTATGCFISFEWEATAGQIAAVAARSKLESKLENYRAGGRAPHLVLRDSVMYSAEDSGKIRIYCDEPMAYSKSSAYPAFHHTNLEIEKLLNLNRLVREAHTDSLAAMYGWIFFESLGLGAEDVYRDVPKVLALHELRNFLVTLRVDLRDEVKRNSKEVSSIASRSLRNYWSAMERCEFSGNENAVWAKVFSYRTIRYLSRATLVNRLYCLTEGLDRASEVTSFGRTSNPDAWFAHLSSWAGGGTLVGDKVNTSQILEICSQTPDVIPVSSARIRSVKSILRDADSLKGYLRERQTFYSGLLNTMYAVRNMASHEGKVGAIDLTGFGSLSRWLTDAYIEMIRNWRRKSQTFSPCADITSGMSHRYDLIVDGDYLEGGLTSGTIDIGNLTQPGWRLNDSI